jgi:phage gp29-like protein
MRNLQLNQQSALILPQAHDPDTRQPLFELELLSLNGGKAMDTSKIKEYYKNLILTSLFADILVLGQSGGGSNALGQIKNSLSSTAAEAMLRKVRDVINEDLIKQTYELNGWDTSRMGSMDFDNLESEDLESFSKAVQRFASTSVIEIDRAVLNRVRESIGVDALPQDEEPNQGLLPNMTSRSGDGFKTAGEGTSTSPSGSDTSSSNLENAG